MVSICVLAVAAVYVLLTQIDFNAYKESIVKIVYNATGRQLTIGDIQVKPSFNPVIEVQDVTFPMQNGQKRRQWYRRNR